MLAASFWLPKDISTHGYQIDRLITWTHYFMAALFVGWGVFFLYCLWRFRARHGHGASCVVIKARTAKVSEVLVVVVEAVLLIWFSMPAWAAYKSNPPAPQDNPLEVQVVAQQFAWNIHYPGPDGKFGARKPHLVKEDTNPIGLDKDNDPDAKDDVVSVNILHMPKDRPIIARLTSKDVIHSFGIAVLRVKQDIIPGMSIPIWFTATEGGEYDIACAQLCGLGHYRMRGTAKIYESATEFEAWYASAGKEEEFTEE